MELEDKVENRMALGRHRIILFIYIIFFRLIVRSFWHNQNGFGENVLFFPQMLLLAFVKNANQIRLPKAACCSSHGIFPSFRCQSFETKTSDQTACKTQNFGSHWKILKLWKSCGAYAISISMKKHTHQRTGPSIGHTAQFNEHKKKIALKLLVPFSTECVSGHCRTAIWATRCRVMA